MRFRIIASILLLVLASSTSADAATVGVVANFGPPLASNCPFVEGIAADPRGNIYASSLNAAGGGNGKICVFAPDGTQIDTISVAPGAGASGARLLGMLYVPGEGLYVTDIADFNGTGRVLLVDPVTDTVTTLATGFLAPNALAKDDRGGLFVTDSFAGNVTRINGDGSKTTWSYPQLVPAGFPPFGANGLAFDRTQTYLYVANTSTDTVYRIRYDGGALGAISTFATGIDGADGIAFDARGQLYVCANQANRIVVLADDGSVATTYAGSGADALFFPASLVFRGRELYITNLSLGDGGTHSKLSRLLTPFPGAPLRP